MSATTVLNNIVSIRQSNDVRLSLGLKKGLFENKYSSRTWTCQCCHARGACRVSADLQCEDNSGKSGKCRGPWKLAETFTVISHRCHRDVLALLCLVTWPRKLTLLWLGSRWDSDELPWTLLRFNLNQPITIIVPQCAPNVPWLWYVGSIPLWNPLYQQNSMTIYSYDAAWLFYSTINMMLLCFSAIPSNFLVKFLLSMSTEHY